MESRTLNLDALQVNSRVWRDLYSLGKNDLQYPSDVLVRVAARLFGTERDQKILDFGFGTGANLLHFASLGYDVHGVEIAEHALARAQRRFEAADLEADLRLIQPGQRLPFEDDYFDIAYAWQVLYYSDRDDWRAQVNELQRVTKPGGLVLAAVAAPGDISQLQAEPLGDYMYRSSVGGQEGCILTIPDLGALPQFFPSQNLEIGEFGFEFGTIRSRHWIVTFRIPNLCPNEYL